MESNEPAQPGGRILLIDDDPALGGNPAIDYAVSAGDHSLVTP